VEENKQLPDPDFLIKDVVRAVKTQWNSFLDAFERAIQLRNPINTFIQYHIDKHEKEVASLHAKGKKLPVPDLYIRVGGMDLHN